jgi:hypothetical protein
MFGYSGVLHHGSGSMELVLHRSPDLSCESLLLVAMLFLMLSLALDNARRHVALLMRWFRLFERRESVR